MTSGSHGATPTASVDIAVIGAGSAGFSAAITAAELGASVAMIGHGTIGGTCVNVGCVPSKALIRAAEAVHHGTTAKRFAGVAANSRLADWTAMLDQKDALVADLRTRKYADLLPEWPGIAYVEAPARFEGSRLLVGGAPLSAGRIIVATGARAAVPPIPGLDTVDWLDSTTALSLPRLPGSLLVIGGGVIGCELGQMFARLGVAVTIVCRSRLLPELDPEVSAALQQYLEAEGIRIRCGARYQRVAAHPQGVELQRAAEDGGPAPALIAERLLVATGRRPNSDGWGLEQRGVALAGNGGIEVDAHMETSVPGIYAAGDVTGRDLYVYMAAYGAKLAARNALEGNQHRYNDRAVPAVVFTDPQVAHVGLTETQAAATGLAIATSTLPLAQLPRAMAARDTRGLVKLVAEAGTGRLLGGQIMAPEGADTVQTLALAIRHGMTAAELGDTIMPYLTNVEGLKLAAQGFARDVSRLSCCAG